MRQFLVVTGLALVLACTAIIDFVLLLFHHGFTWAFVAAITCLLYGCAWFRPTPVLSSINLLMGACHRRCSWYRGPILGFARIGCIAVRNRFWGDTGGSNAHSTVKHRQPQDRGRLVASVFSTYSCR